MARFLVSFLLLLGLVLPHQLCADTIAYWRFEEGTPDATASGTDSILDSSGNGLHGTPLGGPVYRSVPTSGSSLGLEFNVVDDRVVIADDPLFALTESLTLEAFARLDSYATSGVIIWRGDDRSGFDPYHLNFRGDNQANPADRRTLRFLITDASGNTTQLQTALSVPLGETFHVAGTLDDATGAMKLYIDGSVVEETTTTTRPFGPLDPSENPRLNMSSAGHSSTNVFNGIIDEVRISNVALDSSQFVPEPSTILPGDMNKDGLVNGLDVDPFVDVLLNGLYQPEADMNDDQVVNGLDVDGFVAAVVGGAQSIPEPSTLLLALVALGTVAAWRKWQRAA